jgi:hypothetical protein
MQATQGYQYIITIAKADGVLDLVLQHGEVGRVINKKTVKNHKTFKVYSIQPFNTICNILAGNGDYNSTIVRLGSQTGEPLFPHPFLIRSVNRW